MTDFLNFLTGLEINAAIVVMLMLFATAMALFHSFLLFGMLEIEFKPGWIFFILNPAIIGATFLINSKYTFLVFLTMFASVFIIAFYSMIKVSIKNIKKDAKETRKFNKKYNIAPTPFWKKTLRSIVGLAVIALLFSSGAYAFVIIFAYLAIERLLPSSKNQFLKIQATLPTSRIRSVAMGLAEISGSLKMIEPILSPIKKKECIGFVYEIDKVHKDKEGKKSYSNVFTKTKVKPFIIKDDTGEMTVIPDKLEFLWIAVEDRHERGGKRYTQYLLKEGDDVLMIGKVTLKNNAPILAYENIKNVFVITPKEKILHYNVYKPLLNSFVIFTALFAFISALVLISPTSIENNTIVIEKPVFKNYWKDINSFDDLIHIFDQQAPSINDGETYQDSNNPSVQEAVPGNNVTDTYLSEEEATDAMIKRMNEGILEGPK